MHSMEFVVANGAAAASKPVVAQAADRVRRSEPPGSLPPETQFGVGEVYPGVWLTSHRDLGDAASSSTLLPVHRITVVVNTEETDLPSATFAQLDRQGVDYIHLPIGGVGWPWVLVSHRGARISRDVRRAHSRGEAIAFACDSSPSGCVSMIVVWRTLDSSSKCATATAAPCPIDGVDAILNHIRVNQPATDLSPAHRRRLDQLERDVRARPQLASELLVDEEDWLSEVYPRVWVTSLGGVRKHAAALRSQHSVGVVFNLCSEPHQPTTMQFLNETRIQHVWLPTVEAASSDMIHDRGREGARLIREAHDRGESAV